MVNKGNHPQMAQQFRLVKYYNLPRYYSPCILYMVTFTINIPPVLVYIPYMDPMGHRTSILFTYSHNFGVLKLHVSLFLEQTLGFAGAPVRWTPFGGRADGCWLSRGASTLGIPPKKGGLMGIERGYKADRMGIWYILYYIVLYCTILYYIILYYIVLQYIIHIYYIYIYIIYILYIYIIYIHIMYLLQRFWQDVDLWWSSHQFQKIPIHLVLRSTAWKFMGHLFSPK